MPFPQSGTVDLSTKEGVKGYLFARLATQQSTNIAANDHLKFDTVIASRGRDITLDTTTAYSNSNGAASIGRVTLLAGKTYHLRCAIPYLLGSGATGLLEVEFNDVTGTPAALPGVRGELVVATDAGNDAATGVAEAVFTPTQDSLVEVRIITATALTRIGTTSTQCPSLWVETDV